MDNSGRVPAWVGALRGGWASIESEGKASSFITIIRKPGCEGFNHCARSWNAEQVYGLQ